MSRGGAAVKRGDASAPRRADGRPVRPSADRGPQGASLVKKVLAIGLIALMIGAVVAVYATGSTSTTVTTSTVPTTVFVPQTSPPPDTAQP